jgi:hypothetical protein
MEEEIHPTIPVALSDTILGIFSGVFGVVFCWFAFAFRFATP